MNRVTIEDLIVGQKYLFQLSNWHPANLKHVEIRYVGDKYIVMVNLGKGDEYCVSTDPFDCLYGKRTPDFYVSEEL